MTFEVDVLKEILTELKKTNDLLGKIVNIQPKQEQGGLTNEQTSNGRNQKRVKRGSSNAN